VPKLADARQEECKVIFDALIGALAARGIVRAATKMARFPA